jgi:hypothetical protein
VVSYRKGRVLCTDRWNAKVQKGDGWSDVCTGSNMGCLLGSDDYQWIHPVDHSNGNYSHTLDGDVSRAHADSHALSMGTVVTIPSFLLSAGN